jgi:preprotein translocase subunit YajC
MSIAPILATAQAASAGAPITAPSFGGEFISMIPWLLLAGIWFYFLIFRPQRQRATAQAALMAGMKKGDEVVTSGGIKGRLTKVGDDEVEVEIAPGTKVRVVKATIVQIVTRDAKPAND